MQQWLIAQTHENIAMCAQIFVPAEKFAVLPIEHQHPSGNC